MKQCDRCDGWGYLGAPTSYGLVALCTKCAGRKKVPNRMPPDEKPDAGSGEGQ